MPRTSSGWQRGITWEPRAVKWWENMSHTYINTAPGTCEHVTFTFNKQCHHITYKTQMSLYHGCGVWRSFSSFSTAASMFRRHSLKQLIGWAQIWWCVCCWLLVTWSVCFTCYMHLFFLFQLYMVILCYTSALKSGTICVFIGLSAHRGGYSGFVS